MVFGTACVIGTMVLGFAVALLLNQRLKGNVIFAVAVLLPWAVPALAASAIWKWLFDARYGFVNWALVQPRLRAASPTTRGSRTAGSAYVGDLRHGRLAVVPVHRAARCWPGCRRSRRRCSQAAAVDGASAWQRFRLVTLPLLRPIIAVLVIFSTIWDFKIFDQIYVMAAGVPDRARGHRGRRRLPRGLRAEPLRPGLGGRRRAVPDPARVLSWSTCG